jgi:DNA topoisomerase-1
MAKALVIVESPVKAKTINKYLGKQYVVKASLGHIKDLPKKDLSVDVANGFEPHYEVIEGKKKLISELKQAAKGVDNIYLAADPDREGEAICYHLQEELQSAKKGSPHIFRVMFNEITKKAIDKAFESPGQVNINLVDAQQARRVLDRLVGYKISPLLWDKVRPFRRTRADGGVARNCRTRARNPRLHREGILDDRRGVAGQEAAGVDGAPDPRERRAGRDRVETNDR